MTPPAVPRFPLLEEPGEWDALTLMAATIALEAEGEPAQGQIAVGFVVMNRVHGWNRSVHQVILGADGKAYDDSKPFEVFSAWNDDYRVQAQARLSALGAYEPAWKAAAISMWSLAPDPTNRAVFYLNVPLTRKIRPNHDLPSWYADDKVTAVIGRHTFLIA